MTGALQRALGDNLRAHRLRLGLSQEALGQAWGYSRGYIGALERGERNVSLLTVEQLARYVEVSAIELIAPPAHATDKSVDQ